VLYYVLKKDILLTYTKKKSNGTVCTLDTMTKYPKQDVSIYMMGGTRSQSTEN
jgi:hypothetical protein